MLEFLLKDITLFPGNHISFPARHEKSYNQVNIWQLKDLKKSTQIIAYFVLPWSEKKYKLNSLSIIVLCKTSFLSYSIIWNLLHWMGNKPRWKFAFLITHSNNSKKEIWLFYCSQFTDQILLWGPDLASPLPPLSCLLQK